VKSLCHTISVCSESEPSSSTWPTGDRTPSTFVIRTPLLAPLVSSQRAHDLHGDALDAVDASTLSFHSLSRQNRGRSELAVASSLRRARVRSLLCHCSPNFTQSFAVNRSPFSTHHLAAEPTGEPPFPSSPKSGRRDHLFRRTQCRAL